ncbi:serpin H1-like isoform X2 [Conger conger]|uniref:serpin H1-like isoform X2 n=1 Tax=Conger conger TaxID=82655 RepID=UPI002A5AB551|nr:serpin H1-like isoform X2 [Conger conger]
MNLLQELKIQNRKCPLQQAMALSIAIIAALLSLVVAEPLSKKDPSAMLSESTNNLGLSLYHIMVKDESLKSQNVLFSPVVLTSSLGVMSMGARQNTASQVKSLLNVPLHEDKLHLSISELLGDVSNEAVRNTTWKIGSSIYGPLWAKLTKDFVEKSKVHYGHDHTKINFREKRRALLEINNWAAEKTKGKLSEITSDLPASEGAMFINTMYLKPHWGEAFHQDMVDRRGFMMSRTRTVSLPMMHRTGFYKYYEDAANELQIVEMPLGQKQSSLLIIMPFHVEPLERLENMLTTENLHRWSEQLREVAVAVSLPKIDLDVKHELQKHLQQLGLVEAVDKSKADFSGITGNKDLHISSFLHATAFEITPGGNPFDQNLYGREELKTPKLFYADHPFIFLIQDKKTNSILLIGRLLKPNDGRHDEL